MNFDELTNRWRKEAEQYEADGALVHGGRLLCRVADELEDFLRRTVNVSDAAALTGYSEAHLRELAREGRVPAVKQRDEWRFVTADLPARPRSPGSVVDELAGL